MCPESAVVDFPRGGALRIHPTPDQLPRERLRGESGPYRYDDANPDPASDTAFSVRYLASSLRGCLVEVLAQFRPPNDETRELLRSVANVTDDAGRNQQPKRGLSSYLSKVKIGRCQVFPDQGPFVSVHDSALHAVLDSAPPVRDVLDSTWGQAFWGVDQHIDEAKVRLDGKGRRLTQAISTCIHQFEPRPAGIHYRSKHDDNEDCWAIYDHTQVTFADISPLDPAEARHRAAVADVAALWEIDPPRPWMSIVDLNSATDRDSRAGLGSPS